MELVMEEMEMVDVEAGRELSFILLWKLINIVAFHKAQK